MCLSRVLFQRCTWNDIVRNGCFLLRAWWRFRACTTGIVEPVLAIESTADAFVQVAFVRTSHGSGLCVAIQTELWTFPTYPGGARPREKSLIRNGVGQRFIPSTKWRGLSGVEMLVRRNALKEYMEWCFSRRMDIFLSQWSQSNHAKAPTVDAKSSNYLYRVHIKHPWCRRKTVQPKTIMGKHIRMKILQTPTSSE